MPPPSSGGVALIQVLGILARYETTRGVRLEQLGHNRPAYVHLVAEAMKHAFADRAVWLGDPDFSPVLQHGSSMPLTWPHAPSASIRIARSHPRPTAPRRPRPTVAGQATSR